MTAADGPARINQPDHQRGDLWSVAGGSKPAANRYRAFIEEHREPPMASLAIATCEGYDGAGRLRQGHRQP